MATIYIHDGPAAVRIQVVGELTAQDVGEVTAVLESARGSMRGSPVTLDLAEVVRVDAAGEILLRRVAADGIDLITATARVEAVVRECVPVDPAALPGPRLSGRERIRCWVARALFTARRPVHRCIECGCVVRKLWRRGGLRG